MIDFSPQVYFDLREYAHKDLFEGVQNVWEALEKIDRYLKLCSLGVIECDVPDSVYLEHPETISIGKNTKIEPGATIKGPCIIGDHCEIRQGAYLRGNVITGNGCVIGHVTEVKNSIFLNGTLASHFNYVGDSILGNQVNLGAGMKCANLRLDHQMINVRTEKVKIPTHLKKFGLIAGDGVQLGCNCVTNPGTILGKGVFCAPCLNIGGVIPNHAKIKSNFTSKM